MSFPVSPTNGSTTTVNGITYIYRASTQSWIRTQTPFGDFNVSGNLTAANISGVVSVNHGGTGASTLTANSVLLGNGTSALQAIAPSTSGNVLTSDGTTWASSAPAQNGLGQGQTWQDVTSSRSYAVVTAGSFVIGNIYTIVTVGTTDFTLIGASANTVGVVFTATGTGSGTGTARNTYKNTTGKPISVSAYIENYNSDLPNLSLTIGGVKVANVDSGTGVGGITIYGIVPNNSTYMITRGTSGFTTGDFVWTELR
jgi:hypothetical protein